MRFRTLLSFPVFAFGFFTSLGVAQAPPPANQTAAVASVTRDMTVLRDAFAARMRAAGYTCKLDVPRLIVEDVPSFGNYEERDNTLHTSAWELLNPPERAFFMQLAGSGADEASAHKLFEIAAHKWIFVHEMGHWWQACNGVSITNHTPYRVEYDANRISLAYWREVDPSVVTVVVPIFQGVMDHMPSPLPAGAKMEDYFNTNYQTLGPSPAYPWFMSRMNLDANAETPAPSFAAILAATAK